MESAENANIWKKFKKKSKIYKLFPFFDKINPYRENRVNHLGDTIEEPFLLHFRTFIRWVIDIVLNGIFFNFVLFIWHIQPINPIYIIGDGVFIWFTGLLLTKLWRGYIDGRKEIERSK